MGASHQASLVDGRLLEKRKFRFVPMMVAVTLGRRNYEQSLIHSAHLLI